MKLYHGGRRRLQVGGFVWPAAITGNDQSAGVSASAPFLTEAGQEAVGAADLSYMRDHVYVTTSLPLAVIYARLVDGGGGVYEVLPVGELVPDNDPIAADGRDFHVPAARVLRVVFPRVKEASAKMMLGWMAEHERVAGTRLIEKARLSRALRSAASSGGRLRP